MVKFSITNLTQTIIEKILFILLLIQKKEENFLHGKLRNVKLLVTKKNTFGIYISNDYKVTLNFK